ncbi:MAG: N4-gp56 family major capsid protein, partial [Candidatus Woesearchaeota archaeon]
MANYSRRVFELADTASSDVYGAAMPVTTLAPRVWLREINDAAKKRFIASQFAWETAITAGNKDVTIPRRTKYLVSGSSGQGSAAENAAMNTTTFNTLSGVTITPVDQNYGIYIANQAVRTNAVDVIRAAREELVHIAGDAVDMTVIDALIGDGNKSTSTVFGSQAIYGGDASSGATLTTGDVVATDMVAAGKRKLMSTTCKYWTYGTSEANSSDTKNPWTNDNDFVLLIAPEQEETYLTDSQFVNASEYGSNTVINTGEIGSYLNVKVAVSTNTKGYAVGATHADGTTTAVAQHRCAMFKARKAYGLAWGLKPRLVVFDFPSNLQKRLVLETSYNAKQIHPDAIVHI